MDKILESLIKLIPLAGLLEKTGMGQELSVTLSGIINIGVISAIISLGKHITNQYKNTKAARNLPHFGYQKVQDSRRYYIPTKFQNESPTREDEPGFSHVFVAKNPLIPFFIHTAFNEKKETDKFYLILADSGMGKTTLMINLYMCYTSFFNFQRKYKMRLYPFGDARILDEIKKIGQEEARQTILLLDAFDEDKRLIPPAEPDGLTDEKRFRQRLDEIIDTVQDFREVIITSRTQYFPGQEHEPYELKIPRFDDQGFHKLAKLYLSPFDSKEIKKYLNKKDGVLKVWNRRKKRKAISIVEGAPKLMVRPMLLGYIDLLVDHQKAFTSTYEIYETMVHEWIEREARKRKCYEEERQRFKADLHTYSRLLALHMFRERKQTEQLLVTKETAVGIANENHLNLCDYEITGQSLLTRDAVGNWKFAHKSIYEFLIAGEVLRDFTSCLGNYDGMDMTDQFLKEKLSGIPLPGDFKFIKGGSLLMGSPESGLSRSDNETQHTVQLDNYYMAKYPVTVAEFETFMREREGSTGDTNPIYYMSSEIQKDKCHPVVNVSWNDAVAYCEWLSIKLKGTFRLPTEAEWEYGCRAGSMTPFYTGHNLTREQANYGGNVGTTTPVGSYPPNAWGLYDMHGNVWEWCGDWYGEAYYNDYKKQGVIENPLGPETGSFRVLRGGGWTDDAQCCRSAFRYYYDPDDRYASIGFRLVFVP